MCSGFMVLASWISQCNYCPGLTEQTTLFPGLKTCHRSGSCQLLGLKIPAIIVMRAVEAEMVTEVEKDVLDEISDKHHTINKVMTIVQFLLRCKTQFRNLQVVEQREIALKKLIRKDSKKVVMQLALKSTKISQGL